MDSDDSQYDSDEIAEIRALAKKMLNKKKRLDIFYNSYNRYAFDDVDKAPEWFQEDEKKHNQKSKPITKEEILKEKEILKQVNDRMPKKVLEAINKKKMRAKRRMEKIKKQAQVISNQEEINEFSKIKQIERLYKKELSRNKEKKKYVVSRSFKVKGGKNSRNVKHVDKRLKKDKRAMKAADKRKRK
jgi:AdoMet-dependent rRNA methyltransferase SPB1